MNLKSEKSTAPAKVDHRPRVARQRRERMRQHILTVIQTVYPGVHGNMATLEEVLRTAGISKGTFYKYFPSLESAAAELGAELAREMIINMAAIYEPRVHPVERVATGFQLFLYRGLLDRRWAAFISHIHNLPSENLLLRYILDDLERGREQGFFRFGSLANTGDFVLGVTIEATRKIADGNGSQALVNEVVTLMLRALGATDALAGPIIAEARDRLLRDGPTKLDWWPRGPLDFS